MSTSVEDSMIRGLTRPNLKIWAQISIQKVMTSFLLFRLLGNMPIVQEQQEKEQVISIALPCQYFTSQPLW